MVFVTHLVPWFFLWSQLPVTAQLSILHTHSTSSFREAFLSFVLCQQDFAHSFSTRFLSTSPVPGLVSGTADDLAAEPDLESHSLDLREQLSVCSKDKGWLRLASYIGILMLPFCQRSVSTEMRVQFLKSIGWVSSPP